MTHAASEPERGLPPEELARLRQTAYRVLAAVLGPLAGEHVTMLPPLARTLPEETRALAGFAFWGEWTRLLRALAVVDAPARPRAVLHESARPSGAADAAAIVSSLLVHYREAGFTVPPHATELVDHVATELEFMGLLCREEGAAWERRDGVEADAWLAREAAFLDEHLGRWLPGLAADIGASGDADIVRLAAATAHAFVAHDCGLVAVLRPDLAEGPA